MKRIRVEYRQTVQVRQYEPVQLAVAIEEDIDPDSNVKEILDAKFAGLKTYVNNKFTEIVKDFNS